MIYSIKGLWLTLVSTMNGLRSPVTRQYPEQGVLWNHTEAPTPVQDRFMGFPALTWDGDVVEPYCTGCMICIRNCPTQCMSANMKDNPLQQEGKSSRRKIIDTFEINLNRCILCGICVDVCNFDAIVMSHEHEMSTFQRNGDWVNLPALLDEIATALSDTDHEVLVVDDGSRDASWELLVQRATQAPRLRPLRRL